MLLVKVRRSRDAPGDRPRLVRSFHASSTYLRRFASAFGAGSVATTSNPRARYWAAQLAPMTPVPTMAMRRIGFLNDILITPVWLLVNAVWMRCSWSGNVRDEGQRRLQVRDTGEVALCEEQRSPVRAGEVGAG